MTKRSNPSTLKEVARAAGVSVATVSRAISAPALLNAETLAKVQQAIKTLDYRPNLMAQSLRLSQTSIALIVVPSLSPFFLEFVRGAEQAAREVGYSILVGHTDRNAAREFAFIDQVNSKRADGIILVTSSDPEGLLSGLRLPPAVLALDVTTKPQLPTVRVDHVAAAAEATGYLLALGHRRIAHIAGPSASAMALHRLEGYRAAMQSYGLAHDPRLLVTGAFTVESGEAAMEELLSRKVAMTAIFAANDEMAVGAIRAIRKAGLSVPGDISVFGFDDQRIAAIYDPPISTMRIPTYEIGFRSMTELKRILDGEPVEPDIILPCQLVARQSVRALEGPQPGAMKAPATA